ncbi:hypothetical protein M501DRAFT_999966 [Patellaria atrata CBS 101060]|uniref:Uncharacterized protein n=1 Tax=Patellaria atrata CBS 101060 TaxID=1346257 RepID=A0A9P4VM16_9PEZI|nr:hypothetical protein M501DRAFT_999966 [Patellaria atrata CBS 101060]
MRRCHWSGVVGGLLGSIVAVITYHLTIRMPPQLSAARDLSQISVLLANHNRNKVAESCKALKA